MLHALMNEGSEVSGIVGVVAEIGKVDDEGLDAVLSSVVGKNMQTVVVTDHKAADKWRQQLKDNPFRIALLPLNNVSTKKSVLVSIPN